MHARLRRRAAPCSIYLRPEDVLARPIAAGRQPTSSRPQIEKIEFLGSVLPRAGARARPSASSRLTVYLSLNFLAEHQLEVGGRLPLRLLPERIRLFT